MPPVLHTPIDEQSVLPLPNCKLRLRSLTGFMAALAQNAGRLVLSHVLRQRVYHVKPHSGR